MLGEGHLGTPQKGRPCRLQQLITSVWLEVLPIQMYRYLKSTVFFSL